MSRFSPLALVALLATACADPEGADDTADTADTADTTDTADTSGDTADTGDSADSGGDTDTGTAPTTQTVHYGAESPTLSAGGWKAYILPGDTNTSGQEALPSGITATTVRSDAGYIRPTTSHMQIAEPLAGPAGGNQAYWISATGAGTANAADVTTMTFAGPTELIEGTGYTVSWVWGRRKDINNSAAKAEVLVDGAVVHTATFDPDMAGYWYLEGYSYTGLSGDAGKPLALRITHSTQMMATYQVLVDEVKFTWEE